MKYVIDIEDKPIEGTDLYRSKAFNTLVFDRYGLGRLQKYEKLAKDQYNKGYQEGFKDGKEVAEIMHTEIICGDEVEAFDTNEWVRFIATGCDEVVEIVTGINERGGWVEYPLKVCRKTGRHFQITFTETKKNPEK